MSLPIPLLLGLLLLVVHEQSAATLPGAADLKSIAPFGLLLAVPWLAARWVRGRLSHEILWRGVITPSTRIWIGVPALLTPACYGVLLFAGHWPEVVQQNSYGLHVVEISLILAPLLLMDITVRYGERSTEAILDKTLRFVDPRPAKNPLVRFVERLVAITGPVGPSRVSMTVFLAVPILMFAALTDLVFVSLPLEAFFLHTSLGTTIGMLVAIVALCIVLPWSFRITMRTSPQLPRHHEEGIRETVRALGFRSNAVLALDTDRRTVNAALVGPLPWPRYLVLTDGIMTLLDPDSLRGVVAHEVGHARANHPGLLLLAAIGVPVLLLHPLSLLDLESISPTALFFAGAIAALGIVALLRRLFHRFEFEADQRSAEALGGAQPCINALRRVGELTGADRDRASFRHPSEAQRIRHLESWDRDEAYRATDRRTGRRVRFAILGAFLAAAIASAAAHTASADYDRSLFAFYTGDFASARAVLDDLEPLPPLLDQDTIHRFRDITDGAIELAGPGGPNQWNDLADRLGRDAWRRGTSTLLDHGAREARRWFALTFARPHNTPIERAMLMLCDAIDLGDVDRAKALRAHALALSQDAMLTTALQRLELEAN